MPLGRADRQALDVVAAPREQLAHADERARLVLDEDGQRVDHADTASAPSRSSYSSISTAAAPAGIIGKHCSCASTLRVHDRRAAAGQRLRQRLVELALVRDGEALGAVGLRERGVVGHGVRQMHVRAALLEEHALPLIDHAEVAVVDDHRHDRQVLEHGGGQLLARHLEAAVAVHADHGCVRSRRLRADRGRDAVAHRPEPARGDERARPVAEQVLHRPHLVLADAGRPDHVVAAGGQLLQRLEHPLRLQLAAVAVAQRELLAPAFEPAQPGLRARGVARRAQPAHLGGEVGQDLLQRPDHRDVGAAQLVDLGRVDVEVDDGGAGGEGVELAGDAVVESCAHRDEHVAGVHRQVRPLRARACRASRSAARASPGRRPSPSGS